MVSRFAVELGFSLALVVALAAPAAAQNDPRLEVVVVGDGGGQAVPPPVLVDPHPHAIPIADPVQPPGDDGALVEARRETPLFSFGFLMETTDLSELELGFDDSLEISALAGRTLPATGLTSWSGGGMFSSGARHHGVLRMPELRLGIGGGDLDARWLSPANGEADGLEVRATGFLYLRAELALGIELPLGAVVPFALARAGYTGWFIDVEVRDAALGNLGTELVADGAWDLGVEVGVAIEVDEHVDLTAAWRRSFTGPAGDGLVVGVTVAPE